MFFEMSVNYYRKRKKPFFQAETMNVVGKFYKLIYQVSRLIFVQMETYTHNGLIFFDKGENKFYYVCPFFYIKNDLISATTTHEHYHGFHCFEVDENMFSNMRAKFLNECFFSQTEETFFLQVIPMIIS